AFVPRNLVRALLQGLTGARIVRVPDGPLAPQLRQLTRFSAAFALVSDLAMGTLGGKLKRREKISGRLADALAWMYLASASIKRLHDEQSGAASHDAVAGRAAAVAGNEAVDDAAMADAHRDLARWSCELALHNIQQALGGVIDNFPVRWLALLANLVVFPLGRRLRPPRDRLGGRVARGILEDRAARRSLTTDVFVPPPGEPGLGALEAALDAAVRALPVETKLRDAVRAGTIDRPASPELDELALAAGVISQAGYERFNAVRACRDELIAVDSFSPGEYRDLH